MEGEDSFIPETNLNEESFLPETITGEVSSSKVLNTFSVFTQSKSQGETNNEIFEIYLRAFDLCPLDPNSQEESIKKGRKNLEIIGQCFDTIEESRTRFGILTKLHFLPMQSPSQLELFFNIDKKRLHGILNELVTLGSIEKLDLENPDAAYFNKVLRHTGLSAKKKFYRINRSNPSVQRHIEDVVSMVRSNLPVLYEKIQLKKQSHKANVRKYDIYSDLQEERNLNREINKGTKLRKVRLALIPLIGEVYPAMKLFAFLHHTKGLVSEKKWFGKRKETFRVGYPGLQEYMIEQGFLEVVPENEGSQIKIRITRKVIPPDMRKESGLSFVPELPRLKTVREVTHQQAAAEFDAILSGGISDESNDQD